MIAPRYQDVPPERIPTARADHWKNSESSVKVSAQCCGYCDHAGISTRPLPWQPLQAIGTAVRPRSRTRLCLKITDTHSIVDVNGHAVRIRLRMLSQVVAGAFNGTAAVIDTHTPIAYLDIRLGAGDWISQPIPREQVSVYRYSGCVAFSWCVHRWMWMPVNANSVGWPCRLDQL